MASATLTPDFTVTLLTLCCSSSAEAPGPNSLAITVFIPISTNILTTIGPAPCLYETAGFSSTFTSLIEFSLTSIIVKVFALPKTFETASSIPLSPSVGIASLIFKPPPFYLTFSSFNLFLI